MLIAPLLAWALSNSDQVDRPGWKNVADGFSQR
jgi:hypothetical protein